MNDYSEFYRFVTENECDCCKKDNLVSEDFVPKFETRLGMRLGPQLKDYMLRYGYIGYKYWELEGACQTLGLNSSLIHSTDRARRIFDFVADMVVIVDIDGEEFYLVDSKDEVYHLLRCNRELVPLNIDFYDFIVHEITKIKNIL